jgi:adenylate cyclase
MRINLHFKLLSFSILLALVPIAVGGGLLVRLVQGELKSSVNDELLGTATTIAEQIDQSYREGWLNPLLLLRTTVDSPALEAPAKLAALSAMLVVEDLVALQLGVEEGGPPVLISRDAVSETLRAAGADPSGALSLPLPKGRTAGQRLAFVAPLQRWLLTIDLPLERPLQGRPAWLSARYDLGRLLERLAQHPFQRVGRIDLLGPEGHSLLRPETTLRTDTALQRQVLPLLEAGNRSAGAILFSADDGRSMLGGYAFPQYLPWAVLAEREAEGAYLAVTRMMQILLLWMGVGLGAAVVAATLFARRISRPVVALQQVAERVGAGDLHTVVPLQRRRDEIGRLAERMNEMIAGLRDRERVKDIFGRYQSTEVMRTLLESPEALGLGGEQRRITVMFTDLRGFTALSARRSPQEVVRLLNHYFEHMVEVCQRHNGTINEIVGDGLVVFFGAPLRNPDHARDALACALAMQLAMQEVNRRSAEMGLPPLEMGIGLNSGEVVVGNIGSSLRAKYTAVGSEVNLASRIESYTVGGQILASPAVLAEAGPGVEVRGSRQVHPKGMAGPLTLHDIAGLHADGHALRLPDLDETLTPLAQPLEVRILLLAGKHLAGEGRSGRLLALSQRCGLLELAGGELPPLTNLRLDLRGADGGDLYCHAKVLGPLEGGVRIRFTEVPPETAAWLAAAEPSAGGAGAT